MCVFVLVSKPPRVTQPLDNVVRINRLISPSLVRVILHSPYAFGLLCLQPVNCVSDALRAPAKKPRDGNKNHSEKYDCPPHRAVLPRLRVRVESCELMPLIPSSMRPS